MHEVITFIQLQTIINSTFHILPKSFIKENQVRGQYIILHTISTITEKPTFWIGVHEILQVFVQPMSKQDKKIMQKCNDLIILWYMYHVYIEVVP